MKSATDDQCNTPADISHVSVANDAIRSVYGISHQPLCSLSQIGTPSVNAGNYAPGEYKTPENANFDEIIARYGKPTDRRRVFTQERLTDRNLKRHETLRDACHVIMRIEVQAGRLLRAKGQACVDCAKPATCYDHRDYRLPLQVEPVCRSCNQKRGRALPYADLPRRAHRTAPGYRRPNQ